MRKQCIYRGRIGKMSLNGRFCQKRKVNKKKIFKDKCRLIMKKFENFQIIQHLSRDKYKNLKVLFINSKLKL